MDNTLGGRVMIGLVRVGPKDPHSSLIAAVPTTSRQTDGDVLRFE